MEPQEIFKEVMKSEELQTHFGITKEEASSASYTGVNCVANRRTIPATFQGIMKKVSD